MVAPIPFAQAAMRIANRSPNELLIHMPNKPTGIVQIIKTSENQFAALFCKR